MSKRCDLSRIPDPKAPGFTYRDERSTPVAEEFKEARRAKQRKQLPQLPTRDDEPIPYVLTEKAAAFLGGGYTVTADGHELTEYDRVSKYPSD